MRILTTMLRQDCVRWPFIESDRRGVRQYGEPEEMKCRWVDEVETHTEANGETAHSHATVCVQALIPNAGDAFAKGVLADFTDMPENLLSDARIRTVMRVRQTPTLRADKALIQVYLT